MKRKKTTFVVLLILVMGVPVGCGGLGSVESSQSEEKSFETEQRSEEKTSETTEATMITTIEAITESTTEEKMSEESFLMIVKDDVKPSLGPRDKIEEVSFSGNTLIVKISLEKNNRTIDRFTSVTDKILSIDKGYELWDLVTVDFGDLGSITKSKDDIYEDNGKHFKVEESDIEK